MAGKAILTNANEIMRVMQIANVAGTTAARAVQIASISTGVLTGLFVGMDIYFVAKDSHELKMVQSQNLLLRLERWQISCMRV